MNSCKGLQSCCPHPGGEQLTERMLEISYTTDDCIALDFGCGKQETISLLESRGIRCFGLEKDPQLCDGINIMLYTEDNDLPYADGRFDRILAECSLSCNDDPVRILSQLRRILKQDGLMLVSDLVSTIPSSVLRTEEEYEKLFLDSDLKIIYQEDVSYVLVEALAKIIFEQGKEKIAESLGISDEDRRRLKPRYLFWVLGKRN